MPIAQALETSLRGRLAARRLFIAAICILVAMLVYVAYWWPHRALKFDANEWRGFLPRPPVVGKQISAHTTLGQKLHNTID